MIVRNWPGKFTQLLQTYNDWPSANEPPVRLHQASKQMSHLNNKKIWKLFQELNQFNRRSHSALSYPSFQASSRTPALLSAWYSPLAHWRQ